MLDCFGSTDKLFHWETKLRLKSSRSFSRWRLKAESLYWFVYQAQPMSSVQKEEPMEASHTHSP